MDGRTTGENYSSYQTRNRIMKMTLPKFQSGDTVCFFGKANGHAAICSGIVNILWFNPIQGLWYYKLMGWDGEFHESQLMNYIEAFGEYYEKNSGENN